MRPKGVAEVQGKPPANPWLAGLLIGIVLLYVGLLIGIPLVNVFYQALREGIPSFFSAPGGARVSQRSPLDFANCPWLSCLSILFLASALP
jgi:ABC-type sulfate transport system permease subunit